MSASNEKYSERYLVRFGAPEAQRSLIWDAARPLPVGYPARLLIERTAQGVRVRDLRGALNRGYAQGFAESPLENGQARLQHAGLRIELRKLDRAAALFKVEPQAFVFSEPQPDNFKKMAQYSLMGLAAFLLVALLVPPRAPKLDSELIPAQFAKVLLKPQPKEAVKGRSAPVGGAASESQATGPAKSVAKAADTAVVRAFRARSLQSSVQGLLKGGMTTLLAAQGQLLAGADSSQNAKRLFDNAPQGDFAAAPSASAGNGKGVSVAAMGGGSAGAGSNVGYGSGQRAGIAGQGQSFVSLDLPGTKVDEGLSKDEVGKVIHAHMSEIRYCYESSIIRSPDLEGKLVLDFTIGGNGFVKTAAVKESSLNDPRLDDCILRRLTKWAFPKPNGGVDVAVSYPFIFKALKR